MNGSIWKASGCKGATLKINWCHAHTLRAPNYDPVVNLEFSRINRCFDHAARSVNTIVAREPAAMMIFYNKLYSTTVVEIVILPFRGMHCTRCCTCTVLGDRTANISPVVWRV